MGYTVGMKKRVVILAIAIAMLGAGWWYVTYQRPDLLAPLQQIADHATGTVQETVKNVSAPPPLRATSESPKANLTATGTFSETNRQRTENGLPALTANAKLTAAAQAKLNDMFAQQYFAHESPDGKGPGELAKTAGYAYITVGENLALGNFADDRTLVQAWMDSPGHRANILSTEFRELGVAVGRGTYEGRTTWLAVQEFGRPLADCPQADANLKIKIDADRAQLDQLETQMNALKAEIEASSKPRTREERDAYNAKVDSYNAIVRQVNALISQIQGEITVYNGQIQAFNACATG